MENVIFNELCNRGFSVDVGVVTLNSKNSEGVSVCIPKKIDFVANRFGERVYIQSAFAIPDEQKMKEVTDSFRKVVISRDAGKRWYDDNG